MKITKQQLKQLIKEELNEIDIAQQFQQKQQAPDEQAPPEEPKILDVNRMMQYINKIDTPLEYQNLLSKVVAHAKNVRGSKLILMKLVRDMTALTKDL